MNKLEELKMYLQVANNEYKNINAIKNNQYDMIIGCLNRISVSDNEDEVERLYNYLINYGIKEYKETARKAYSKYVVYEKIFNVYYEDKKKND